MALLDDLLDDLWRDYTALTPTAARIHQLLRDRGETVRHDHLALRTFDLPGVEIEALDRVFTAEGYEAAQSYEFADEKLVAYHYEHPDERRPRLLISALLVEELSPAAQELIRALVAQIEPGASAHARFAISGRPWPLAGADHALLAGESPYAAWVAAFGFRAHHFAVDASGLRSFAGLPELHRFLIENGVRLEGGGEITGSPDMLEQSSTVPDEVEIELADGPMRLPSCACELARRHPRPDGTLFQGFVAESARR
ncbi:MAG TPA: DUF1338 domain-containing protein [Kofleriaceae bacterium]|nr:DUF1338 domain-containing protein [Kofleriaceae bacterium]